MQSCLYKGRVGHRRYTPVRHEFKYRIFLVYLDLSELDEVFRGRWLWSTRRPTIAWFRRADHFGDPSQSLDESVRSLVQQRTGVWPTGPVRLLTHLRYFGYVMNPVSFFYCFKADGTELQNVVAEVHNTPWNERHCYVLEPHHFSRPTPQSGGKEIPRIAVHAHADALSLGCRCPGRRVDGVSRKLARWCACIRCATDSWAAGN